MGATFEGLLLVEWDENLGSFFEKSTDDAREETDAGVTFEEKRSLC
jgi:hypothetical protein